MQQQQFEFAYIGLGSNLGDSRAILDSAIHALAGLAQTEFCSVSSFYRSLPLGGLVQPDYLNAVACVRTRLEPGCLLSQLLIIEREHGRVRGPQRWAARTLDLDLLVYGERQIQTDELWLPHKEMYRRDFVLEPLREIAPGMVIPGYGSIDDVLAKCPSRGLTRVPLDNVVG